VFHWKEKDIMTMSQTIITALNVLRAMPDAGMIDAAPVETNDVGLEAHIGGSFMCEHLCTLARALASVEYFVSDDPHLVTNQTTLIPVNNGWTRIVLTRDRQILMIQIACEITVYYTLLCRAQQQRWMPRCRGQAARPIV
jgi:hypothetical protein